LVLFLISKILASDYSPPVIAIIAASLPENTETPEEAAVYPTYSKWIVNSGGKVVPIFPWYSNDKVDQILHSVNGVLWQGGMRDLRIGGQFEELNKHVFERAMEINDNGTYLPMFMICQGFELVHILLANDTNILVNNTAMRYYIPMETNNETRTSKMFKFFTEEDFDTFTKENSTVHLHNYGFDPELYTTHKVINDFFTITSYGYDRNGRKFIGTVEGKKYPFYAVQHHPEKVRYDLSIEQDSVVNAQKAFDMNKKFADFFIAEAKMNSHWIPALGNEQLLEIDVKNTNPVLYNNSSWVYLFKKPKHNLN